jgi:organic hydroperoxide reductase OsmC/OhrA
VQAFPHRYVVVATGDMADVTLASGALAPIASATPAEFDGPGDLWSPETLLVSAVASCFALTFRGVARASHVHWTALRCEVTGTLDRIDNKTLFTAFETHALLSVPSEADTAQARRALEKAERSCLISNSLKAPMRLTIEINVVAQSPEAEADAQLAAR